MQTRHNVQLGSRQNQGEVSRRHGRLLVSHASWSGWVDFLLVFWGLCSGSRYHRGDVEYTDMKIQQVVVMYLHDHQISRPTAPPIVSPCTGIKKKFKLGTRKYEEYMGVCFGNGDCALVIDVWFHRVDEDTSGLTFEEWDPSTDTDASEAPVAMIVISSELCVAGFDLREVIPLELEAVARGTRSTRDATLKQIHDMGTRRYVLSVDNDNEFRSRCE